MGIRSLFKRKSKDNDPEPAGQDAVPDLPVLVLSAVVNGQDDIIQLVMNECPTFPWNDLRYPFREEHATEPLLHMAVLADQTPIVKLLLESGKVDGDAYNEGGYNALNFAVVNDRADMIRVMLASGKVDVNKPEAYGSTALTVAARYGYMDVMRVLLEQPGIVIDEDPAVFARTSLMEAAGAGQMEAVKVLMATGKVDVNREGLFQDPAIVYAGMKGHVEVVKWLLTEGGASVTAKHIEQIKKKTEAPDSLQEVLQILERQT